jgi:putative endonuclease
LTRERLDLGKLGEALAIKKVRSLGYKVIAANYRCPMGELDLVARDGDCLVFIEIKTRRRGAIDSAKAAVDARKQRQVSKAALAYMKSNGCCDVKSRFDVVAVSLGQGPPRIEVIKNAFELAY